MKFVFPIALSLLTFAPMAHSAANADFEFQTSCTISLIGVGANAVQETKTSSSLPAARGPRVSFGLGSATLISYVQSTLPAGAQDYEPQLTVELYKKGEGPIAGQINLAGLSGLSVLSVGQKLTAFSRSFLDMTYNGQKFSRIDYTCDIARTK